MKQHEKEDTWEPSNKKIKLSPPEEEHSSRQQVIVVLDQSVGSSKLYDFYQKTIDRDLQEIVILQFMKDFGQFINKNIMKSIPHVVSLEKMCRERSLIISLIQEGLLYESLNGSFHSVTQFFKKDREIKKMLFSKHAFETMEQYTTFIMKAIDYDREGVIFDLVTDSLRDNLDFSLRATLICPKILYKYPERFLNLEFATNYSKREHPRSVMKIFLKDNDSPILEDKDFKKATEFHSDEGFGFMVASRYLATYSNLKYNFFHDDPVPKLFARKPFRGSYSIVPFHETRTISPATCRELFSLLGMDVPCHLLEGYKLYCDYFAVLQGMNVKDLENHQFVKELGFILRYSYKK